MVKRIIALEMLSALWSKGNPVRDLNICSLGGNKLVWNTVYNIFCSKSTAFLPRNILYLQGITATTTTTVVYFPNFFFSILITPHHEHSRIEEKENVQNKMMFTVPVCHIVASQWGSLKVVWCCLRAWLCWVRGRSLASGGECFITQVRLTYVLSFVMRSALQVVLSAVQYISLTIVRIYSYVNIARYCGMALANSVEFFWSICALRPFFILFIRFLSWSRSLIHSL